jgi:hypothetical protein
MGSAAHDQAVQTRHHVPEGLVVLEEAQHDRVSLEDARHAPALDREVDHRGDQHLARPRAGSRRSPPAAKLSSPAPIGTPRAAIPGALAGTYLFRSLSGPMHGKPVG